MVMPVFLSVLLALLTGCTGMVQEELDETHAKLAALQRLVNEANDQLVSLNRIVAGLDNQHTIVPGSFRETEDGFELSFQDGKTIAIHAGIDGIDGKVFPIGVAKDEDGLYYWTIDYTPDDEEGPQWLTDADGNKLLASASDGTDGKVPMLKVEDGAWWISLDGGESYLKLADTSDLDGVGVFSGASQEADRIRLVLWDGSELELPLYSPVKVSFLGPLRDTVLIAGGETLSIPFEVLLDGNTETQQLVITSGTDGTYFSEIVMDEEPGKGVVKVQAPAVFNEGYILLSAYCGGSSALKMISFRERSVTPSDPVIPVRMGYESGSASIPYDANFEYVLSSPTGSWLTAQADLETKTISFVVEPNLDAFVRTCDIRVSPKDNPDFVCSTIRVYQATMELTINPGEIQAPAAGGSFDVWITWTIDRMNNLTVSVPDWITKEMRVESGFCHLVIHVAPYEGDTVRECDATLKLGAAVPVGVIKIVQQAPSVASE